MAEKQSVFSRDTLKNKDLLAIKKSVLREDFVSWMRSNYEALRCYHSTRTTDVGSYYKKGFVPTDMVKAAAYFKQLLEDINYRIDYDIQTTIDQFSGDSDKRIYFCLNREGFLDDSPHYLIYGSELILCFAQHVSPHIKYELKKIGIPTIFHCNIPLSNFDDNEIIELHDKISNSTGTHKQKLNEIFSNYSVVVDKYVSPDCIVHHEHPTVALEDRHSGGMYKNTVKTCCYCAK